MSQRKSRVEHALRDVLTELIASEVKDPRVRAAALLTVTKVELNVDMAVADVYVSVVGGGGSRDGGRPPRRGGRAELDDDATSDGVLAGLAKAAGFLRGPVARKLSLQRAPELRFHLDTTVDVSAKLAAIVREDEDRARAAGREPERAAAPARAAAAAAPAAAPPDAAPPDAAAPSPAAAPTPDAAPVAAPTPDAAPPPPAAAPPDAAAASDAAPDAETPREPA